MLRYVHLLILHGYLQLSAFSFACKKFSDKVIFSGFLGIVYIVTNFIQFPNEEESCLLAQLNLQLIFLLVHVWPVICLLSSVCSGNFFGALVIENEGCQN